MRRLLQICENYGQQFSIQFNATKSACMLVSKRISAVKYALQFNIDGQRIPIVDKFVHLGHIIDSLLDDTNEILTKRNELCGKINNVLCYFQCCDPAVKIKLMHSYCSGFYGRLVCCGICHLVQLRVYALCGEKALDLYGIYFFRLILGLLRRFVSCYRLEMNFCSAV